MKHTLVEEQTPQKKEYEDLDIWSSEETFDDTQIEKALGHEDSSFLGNRGHSGRKAKIYHTQKGIPGHTLEENSLALKSEGNRGHS